MAISSETIKRRIEKVRGRMQSRALEAMLLYSAPTDLGNQNRTSGNVRYLSDWSDRQQPSLLVLPQSGDPVLLVAQKARKRWAERKGVLVEVRDAGSASALGSAARGVLVERNIGRGSIGIAGKAEMLTPVYAALIAEEATWTLELADDLVGVDRVIKDAEEIALHRVAAKMSDSMFSAFMNAARVPGKWAWQLLAEMEYAGRSLGGEYSSGWIGTGSGSLPDMPAYHLWQSARQVVDGDRVEAGTNVTYEGYWAHGIRMGVKGRIAPELREVFDGVIRAQDAGIAALQPGRLLRSAAKALDDVIDAMIRERGSYREDENVRGRAGHSLGLDYFDPLASNAFEMGSKSDIVIQPGMVLEIHPNFSLPGFGFVGLGDVVLVQETGVEVLTRFPRELYEI